MVNLYNSVIIAFGFVVFIYAIIERFGTDRPKKDAKPWDPRELAKIRKEDRFRPVGLIIGAAFTIAALVIFNFFPHWIGSGQFSNGEWTFVSVLAEDFGRTYLPWL